MHSHRPSRRSFFSGLLGALCAWPFLRRTGTAAAEPASSAPIADTVGAVRPIGACAYPVSDPHCSVTTYSYSDDGTGLLYRDPVRVTTYVYDSRGRLYPHWPA